MANVIDRRKNAKGKSTENRQKFIKRVKEAIKEQLPKIISERKIKDIGSSGGNVTIKRNKKITEPEFRHGEGGNRDYVLPGNKKYIPGDTIPKPKSDSGKGKGGSNEGQWEDDFIVELSQKEFLELFFEDLELPNLVKKDLMKIHETEKRHIGFQKDGSPNKLSVLRSYKQSISRRIPALASIKKKIEKLENEIVAFDAETMHLVNEDYQRATEIFSLRDTLKQPLKAELAKLKKKLDKVPFFDPLDLRYKQTVAVHVPTTSATMIMVMDNSGSMGIKEKTYARKYFYLAYSFLKSQYEHVDLVFISHTTEAKEMEEEEFFNTRDSGGTVVSTALELMDKIIQERLTNTNVYVSQISDGDNYSKDDEYCQELLLKKILPFVQYYTYIQIDDYHEPNDQMSISNYLGVDKGLWKAYESVRDQCEHFKIKRVMEESDIFSVFKELFEKK